MVHPDPVAEVPQGASAASAATETERKFAVEPSYALPSLEPLVEVRDEGTDLLLTTYLDSADLRLWREGVVLRHRAGGPDAGWHLKFPRELVARGGAGGASGAGGAGGADPEEARVRLEVALPATAGDGVEVGEPPAALLSLVRVFLARAPVCPHGQIRTRRTRRHLFPPGTGTAERAALAELADDQVTVLRPDSASRAYRELELEELPGASAPQGRSLVDAVAARLRASGAVPSSGSKATHVLGDPTELPPAVPSVPTLDPEAAAADAVRAHLLTYLRTLRNEDLRVRLDVEDSVHQFRVATRRLRSGLRVFRSLLVSGWERPLRDELRWLAHGFAPARDAEVLLARLDAHAGDLPGDAVEPVRTFLRDRLGRELADARQQGLAILDGDRYLALHEALRSAASEPATTAEAVQPCGEALPPLVRRAYRRLEKAAAGLTPTSSDADWHGTRITAKRARYAADACVPALGKPAKKLAARLSRITDVLGEHQDAVVAAATLTRLATADGVPAGTAYWLGVLHQRERDAAASEWAAFAKEWRAASRPKYRRWLHEGI